MRARFFSFAGFIFEDERRDKMAENQVQKKARREFSKGKSYSEISKKLNIPISTLKTWRRRYEWVRETIVETTCETSRKKKVSTKGGFTSKAPPKKKEEVDSSFQKIKENLLNQLKIKDRYEEVYIDLVNDYMSLWELKNELIRDLKERGAQIEVINSKGFKQLKKNDSSDSLLKCNAQMLKLLTELGLSASEVIANRDDDEDDI